MFEELDLHIADGKNAESPNTIYTLACSRFCSNLHCPTNSSCAGTSGKYCC